MDSDLLEQPERKLLTKKNILSVLVSVVLLVGLVITLKLVQTKQIFKSKASSEAVTVTGSNIRQTPIGPEVIDPNQPVEVELRAPYPPAPN